MKNIKKNIVKIAFSVALLGSFASCSDSWLETRPGDMIIDEEFWQTREQLTAAVAGCYASVVDSWRYGNNQPYEGVVGKMIQWGELRADNIVTTTSALEDEEKLSTCVLSASNKLCWWGGLYTVINNCNFVLENGDRVLDTDKTIHQSEVNALKAEALAMRSLMYFYLVRAYKEVPLVTKATRNSTQTLQIAKTTEDTVINQIIEDLKLAHTWAVYSYDNPRSAYDKGRFTRTSISALLADVYLWDGQYQNCIDACNEVLADRNLGLVGVSNNGSSSGQWYSIFNGNSNESIFELQFGNNTGGIVNNMLFQCYGSNSMANHFSAPVEATNWSINSLFLKANSTTEYDFVDVRLTDSYDSYTIESSQLKAKTTGVATITKFPKAESRSANWIVYRLAEIYFMKAEALNALDFDANKTEVAHLINTIYLRAHSSSTTTVTDTIRPENVFLQQDMTDLILKEKQKEFLFEGKRWFDLLRTSRHETTNPMRVFNEFVIRNVPYEYKETALSKYTNEWARYLPVPYNDLQVNKLLKQNPFYVTSLD